MTNVGDTARKCGYSILWFFAWGLFQAYVVASLLIGTWERPVVFPVEAYRALVFPDLCFIPIYFLAAALLCVRSRAGVALGLLAGGAVNYVMVYLLALAKFRGAVNLVADGLFLLLNFGAIMQLSRAVIRNRLP
jgi:hypothetical protein